MRAWNRRSFMLATGLAAAAARAPAQTQRVRADVKPLVDAERKRITQAMRREDIPGVAVCLIHDGQLAWTEGFGVTDQRSKRAIAPDTIFSVQSTSKNFTATAHPPLRRGHSAARDG